MKHINVYMFPCNKKSQTGFKYFLDIDKVFLRFAIRTRYNNRQTISRYFDENATLLSQLTGWTEPGNEILTYQLFHEGQETNVDDLAA